jgi:hypothetical protein
MGHAEAPNGNRLADPSHPRPAGKRFGMTEPRWYLLIHQLPPKPLYLRAKIRQRLERVGAVPLKNSVYVLPRSEGSLEDFQWIAQEAVAGGGDAWVCEADFSVGVRTGELVEAFRRARTLDFEALADEIRATLKPTGPRRRKVASAEDLTARIARFRKRFDELTAIDFFGTPSRHDAEMALNSLEKRAKPSGAPTSTIDGPATRAALVGRTWVTRTGVQIDRIASSWLIRRFVDPEAHFRFTPPGTRDFKPGELRFDMVGGDFTHEGDRCTFETLVARLGISDGAIAQIAQVVHDIDLKDAKYGRADAAGVQQLMLGLVLAHADDVARLERGFALFDDLYRSFGKGSAIVSAAPARRTAKPRRRSGA